MNNYYSVRGNNRREDDTKRGWQPPPPETLQAAAQQASQNTPSTSTTGTAGSPTYGRNIGDPSPGPPNYSASDIPARGTSAWYGQGNEGTMSMMAGDTSAFWQGYGDQTQGFGPGGHANSFLANKYDTQKLGNIFYEDFGTSDENRMAGQTAIADAIMAPGVQFFDPGDIIGRVLGALQNPDPDALMKSNPVLGNLLLSSQGDPMGQADLIIGFLREALTATMPPDGLDAFINQLNALKQNFFSELSRGGMEGFHNANFASWLSSRYGPTLGL